MPGWVPLYFRITGLEESVHEGLVLMYFSFLSVSGHRRATGQVFVFSGCTVVSCKEGGGGDGADGGVESLSLED